MRTCENTPQGRGCLRSTNASRAALGMKPLEGICSTCQAVGTCITPSACELPDLQPIRRRIFTARRCSLLPQTSEGWGRAIGAALGSAGAVYMLWHVARAAGVL